MPYIAEQPGGTMDRRHLLKGMLGLALCPLCAPRGFAAEGAHWSYEPPTGPDQWGDLDPAYKLCSAGTQQSPLDITGAIPTKLFRLRIKWDRRPDTIENTGHSIQLNFLAGNTLGVGERTFTLTQFHFHHPSEHRVADDSFPMEVHFVHADKDGDLAVIGALMKTGKANAAFNRITATMPATKGPPVKADSAIDPNRLLPTDRGHYRYEGSLTTPECKEIVHWFVLATPIQVAEADVAAFAKLYPMNARPVLQTNRRFILRSI
jgi:carbonic anhydrase